MGCFTSTGRVLLIVFNVIFLIVSIFCIVIGALVRFKFSVFRSGLFQTVTGTSSGENTDLDDVGGIPVLKEMGLAQMIFGIVLFVISFLACCGACCQQKVMLIMLYKMKTPRVYDPSSWNIPPLEVKVLMYKNTEDNSPDLWFMLLRKGNDCLPYVVIVTVLVLAEGIIGGLFLKEKSPLHTFIQDTLASKIGTDFPEGDKIFSEVISFLNKQLECCGMKGPDDFTNGFPESCCKIKSFCTNTTIYSEGCYDKLVGYLLQGNTLLYAGLVLAALMLLQIMEAVFAILIVKNKNDRNVHVGPGANFTFGPSQWQHGGNNFILGNSKQMW